MSRPATQHKRATYPAYRPSGMDWVGDIPEHWEIHRLKHVASVQFSSVDKHTLEGEEPVRLCNYVDVYYNDFITADIEFMSASATQSEIARFQLCRGDVLVTKDSESWDDIAVPSYVAEKLEGVLCGYHLAHIRPHPRKLLGEYLFRAFRSRGINDQFRVAANGITRFGLGKYWLDNGLFPVPSLDEQRAIAAFLDSETARIDALIEKKRRQIELLQEKRSALISHAVTKGLDPHTAMKDSGIDGVGGLPAHWALKRLKFLTPHVSVGIVITPSKYYEESGVPCLRSLNVRPDELTENDLVFISPESNELLRKSKLHAGDVVVVRTGKPGTAAVVDDRFDGANCIDLIIVRKSARFDSRFMCYVLNSDFALAQYIAGTSGAIQGHFNIETASNMLIPMPPLEEQVGIRERLDLEVGQLKRLGDKIEESITRLREHRTALISAAVTGKIDVRKEAN